MRVFAAADAARLCLGAQVLSPGARRRSILLCIAGARAVPRFRARSDSHTAAVSAGSFHDLESIHSVDIGRFGMLPRRALRSAAQAGRRGAPRLEAGKLGSSIECR